MKIFYGKNARRGFTLVELCIVIALISIVMVLMISFLAVFRPRVVQNQIRQDFIDEVSRVRDELKRWVSNADVSVIYVEYGGFLLATNGLQSDPDAVVCFGETGLLEFKYSSSDHPNVSLNLDVIKTIELEIYNSKLLKCTFTGEDTYGQELSQTMFFALMSSGGTFTSLTPSSN